ncbi:FAD-binding oxidoreductase [Streptacidiphilus sp. PB12-B1b]|uniref:FAD-binding oxidoreductase n=1 Tax=Streptacidiphilus sp. PB12-B1b TaxID=2705012 RepID=UPI0015FCEF25|nr:FAD-binding oxidoreductase [Streptacidiphilus sp. PB12-B1b]QMU78167.1 FAD-binding oxidoreductase [Streptacidiphilus sp. PB12-B1b]
MTAGAREALETICPDRVITPGHPAYDRVRLLFNGMHDRRPRLICLPRDTAEVQRVIRAAREHGLPTAIRGGGHNIAGSGSLDDGLVVDLRLLDRVVVDPVRRLARSGGGATWAGFDLAAGTYGLAVTGGTFDDTGVGGLTLGGGIGHLMGRHGLSCDNVESYTLVTADGERTEVGPASDPDLDWALRGAGHNFGVVTGFTFRLHPVDRVYGGFVAYSGADLAEAVRLFRDLMTDAPDDLTCTLLLERYGPAQGPAAVMSVCYSGDDPEYPAVLDKALRRLEPIDWRIEERSYVSMQLCLGRLPFGLRHYWSARCVDGLPGELVDGIVDRFREGLITDPFNDTVLIEPIHGAVRSADPARSAVPFRSARFNVTGMAIWDPGHPEADAQQTAWAKSVAAVAEPYGRWGDGYINYVGDSGAAGPERALRTFGPESYGRLAALKQRVDPDNFFRSNYNVSPEPR